MDVRFYETGLRQVASGLARLIRPAPDTIDQLVDQLSTMADIAADAGRGAISKSAQDAQSAVQALSTTDLGARSASIEALGRLGQQLLGDLCTTVSTSKSPAPVPQDNCRVLVVDDSRVASTALLGAFRARNFTARAAVTFEEALVELVLFTPQVMVSDVFMPALEVELIARVFRGLTRGKPGLIVLVSGAAGDALNVRLKSIEHDLFVSKLEGSSKVVDSVLSAWGDDVGQEAQRIAQSSAL
jgi:PleD family two-component response regulator